MTIQADAATLLPNGKVCKGIRHTPTNTSWREGCRHQGAIDAHKQWLVDNGGDRDKILPPRVGVDGNCIADKHDSRRAYRRGCRCERSVKLWEYAGHRRNNRKMVQRGREQAERWDRDARHAALVTGGRFTADPRRAWRGGKMAVGRNNLYFLLHGFADDPTMGERLAAVCLLSETMIEDPDWFRRGHLMNPADIARRIGCTEQTAARLLRDRERLAATRAERRLADVKWKTAVRAEAPARKERSREIHLAAAKRRADR